MGKFVLNDNLTQFGYERRMPEDGSAPNIFSVESGDNGRAIPSFFEEALIASTGRSLKDLVENGMLLKANGEPFERNGIIDKQLDFFTVPPAIEDELKNGRIYFRSSKDGPEANQLYELTFDPNEKSYNGLKISNEPLSAENLPELPANPGFFARAMQAIARGINTILRTNLVYSEAAEKYSRAVDALKQKRDVIRKLNIRDTTAQKAPWTNPGTRDEVRDRVEYYRDMCHDVVDRHQKRAAGNDVKEAAANANDPKIRYSAEYQKEVDNIREFMTGQKFRLPKWIESGVADQQKMKYCIAGMLVKTMQDGVMMKGGGQLPVAQLKDMTEKLVKTEAFEDYLSLRYDPNEFEKAVTGGNRKLMFDQLSELAVCGENLDKEERAAYKEIISTIGAEKFMYPGKGYEVNKNDMPSQAPLSDDDDYDIETEYLGNM